MSNSILDLEYFRDLLIKQKKDLSSVADIGDESSSVVELDQSRVGRLSRMDAMQLQAMSKEVKQRREITLQKIEQSLKRIDNNEYGICVKCGEEISEQRLKADPSTPICIICAQ